MVDVTANRSQAGRGATKSARSGLSSAQFINRIAGDPAIRPEDLKPSLPSDLVGGSVPYIPGTEEEAVWNAASFMCGTERIHYTYTIEGDRCWYIAVPSSSLASYPDSWCPITAALPGNSEYWDKETVYLYEQESQASALRWDPETGNMKLYLGPSRTILPYIQSMDANFVTINAATAQVVPWVNRDLKTDKLSRAAARIMLLSGIIATVIAFAFIVLLYVSAAILNPRLDLARAETDSAANQLLNSAAEGLENVTIQNFNRIQELLDSLYSLKGTLVRYEVKADGSIEWEALVPPAYTVGSTPSLAGSEIVGAIEKDGRVRIIGKK